MATLDPEPVRRSRAHVLVLCLALAAPLFLLALSDVSESEAGVSSGVLTTAQQIGGALGIAVLVAIAAARTDGVGGDPVAALNSGYHAALWCGASLSALAIPVALVAFRGGRDVAGAAHH